jgi:peptide/nickel transport system permease protein
MLAANFAGFAYAQIAMVVMRAQNPFGSGVTGTPDILPLYGDYLSRALRLEFDPMPLGMTDTVGSAILKAAFNSLGLLAIAFFFTLIIGFLLGLAAVRTEPVRLARWLTPLTTLGLAIPSFFLATIFIVLLITTAYQPVKGAAIPFLPVAGFGWDQHLILPILVLMVRPTMQITQIVATQLQGELNKQYVVAARSFGKTWWQIRSRWALKTVLAPVILGVAGSFRYLMAELLLVEWFFNWPGLGRLLVFTLVPPATASVSGMREATVYYLNPPLIATLLAVFTLLFMLTDLAATIATRLVDPRLREDAGKG